MLVVLPFSASQSVKLYVLSGPAAELVAASDGSQSLAQLGRTVRWGRGRPGRAPSSWPKNCSRSAFYRWPRPLLPSTSGSAGADERPAAVADLGRRSATRRGSAHVPRAGTDVHTPDLPRRPLRGGLHLPSAPPTAAGPAPGARYAPSLSAATLSGILTREGLEHEVFPLEHLWAGECEPTPRAST